MPVWIQENRVPGSPKEWEPAVRHVCLCQFIRACQGRKKSLSRLVMGELRPFTGWGAYSGIKPAICGNICLLLGLFCHAFYPSLLFAVLFRASLNNPAYIRFFLCSMYHWGAIRLTIFHEYVATLYAEFLSLNWAGFSVGPEQRNEKSILTSYCRTRQVSTRNLSSWFFYIAFVFRGL